MKILNALMMPVVIVMEIAVLIVSFAVFLIYYCVIHALKFLGNVRRDLRES
jgi:hypothetical protein